jgi:hypothetical protein
MHVTLIVSLICGVVTAIVGNSKGRSPIGWFFVGFFLGIIGLIISFVVSDLNREREFRSHSNLERRRLREQLKQERMKNEAFRRHAGARLDRHDRALGVDTRAAGRELTAEPASAKPALPRPDSGRRREREWFYEAGGEERGPVPESVVRDMLSRGALGLDTLVWTEGLQDWTPAGRVSAFARKGLS